jgi:hypothetical protein
MKFAYASLFLYASLLSCRKDSPGLTQVFTLGYREVTTLPVSGSVHATLTELNDSRCPSNATCIWAGTIAAKVELTDGTTTQTLRLGYEKPYGADSVAVVLASQRYWLRLLDAKPYPTTTNGSQPRQAFFRLRPS